MLVLHPLFSRPPKATGFWVHLHCADYFDAVGLPVVLVPPVVPGLTPPVILGLTFAVGALVTDGLAENDGSTLTVGTVKSGSKSLLSSLAQPAKIAVNAAINMISKISFFIQFASFGFILCTSGPKYFAQFFHQPTKNVSI